MALKCHEFIESSSFPIDSRIAWINITACSTVNLVISGMDNLLQKDKWQGIIVPSRRFILDLHYLRIETIIEGLGLSSHVQILR